jgi:hypothetical protein
LLDLISLIGLFWYTAILDVPRYTTSAIVAVGITLWCPSRRGTSPSVKFSVLLVGHNEEHSLRACVNSLWEQTIARQPGRMQVVVVGDGSTDAMADVAYRLQRLGKINELAPQSLRSS